MNEEIIEPHWPGHEGEAEVCAIGCQIGVVGRNHWNIQQPRRAQADSPQNYRVNQMDNVRLKLAQATHKEGTEEVKLQFGIEGQRQSCRSDHLRTCVFFHPALRSK